MKIVADSAVPYLKGVFEPFGKVSRLPFIGAEDVRDADVLIVRTRTRCDETLLAGSSVRLVATATAGTDHIDMEWCAAHGIEVVSAPGCNARAVLQWVAAGLAWWAKSGEARKINCHSEEHAARRGPIAEARRKWASVFLRANLPPRSDCPPPHCHSERLWRRNLAASCHPERSRRISHAVAMECVGRPSTESPNGSEPPQAPSCSIRDAHSAARHRLLATAPHCHSEPSFPPTRHSERLWRRNLAASCHPEPVEGSHSLPDPSPRSSLRDDKTIGVIGVGHVGTLVANYAESWGFEVLRRDPAKGFDTPLEEIAERCDIITFHVPLTAETHYMAGADFFNRLRPNALIINASRGEVVNGAALMQSGHPCLIDVWENEPNVDPRFVEYASLATPHIAGYSMQGKANATAAVVQAVAQRFGIGSLTDWYPAGIRRPAPRPISWEELLQNSHYDIYSDSRALKEAFRSIDHPDTPLVTPASLVAERYRAEKFESLRTSYHFREESF